MKQTTNQCVYCGSQSSTTQDHIPPKSFYPEPRPSNLITVPACFACNNSSGKDEEFFLATYMFSDAGVSPTGKKLWDQTLHRMYAKNRGLRRRIASLLRPVRLTTPSGLFLGRGIAIKQEEPRLARVVEKIIRGIYFFEYNERLDPLIKIAAVFLRSEEDAAEPMTFNNQLYSGSRDWPDVFEYRFNRVTDKPEDSMWIIRFFGRIVYWAISSNENEFLPIKSTPDNSTVAG